MAGTLLTARDTFLTRAEAMQLVYSCCSPTRPGLVDESDLALPPPAMRKPRTLWTGKQVRMAPCSDIGLRFLGCRVSWSAPLAADAANMLAEYLRGSNAAKLWCTADAKP